MTIAVADPITIMLVEPTTDADQDWVAGRAKPLADAGLGVPRHVVGLFVRDRERRIVAGARLDVLGTDLIVRFLWAAAERRGQGLGTFLMIRAEAVAQVRGCRRMAVDTMAFQGPDFYPRFGYEVIGVLPRFAHGADRTYFRKPAGTPLPPPPLPDDLSLEVADAPDDADLTVIDDGLTAHWREAVGHAHTEAAFLARDRNGTVVAGLNAVHDHRWWFITDSWIEPSHRGRGLARRLVAALEDSARANDAESVAAIPYEWQSPSLLQHLGYATVTHFPDAVLGRPRWFLRKELRP